MSTVRQFNPDGTLLWAHLDADGPGIGLMAHAQMLVDGAGNACLACA